MAKCFRLAIPTWRAISSIDERVELSSMRLTIVDTYRSTDDFGGISEIMFSQIPEPSTVLLLGLGGLLLVARRR